MKRASRWWATAAILLLIAGTIGISARRRAHAAIVEEKILDEKAAHLAANELPPNANRMRAPAKAAEGANPHARRKRSALHDPVVSLEHSPALQAKYLQARRINLRLIYGPLYRHLHLSDAQIGSFESALIRHESSLFDLLSAVPAGGQHASFSGDVFSPNPLAVSIEGEQGTDASAAATLADEAKQIFRQEATAALGADGYEQYLAYEAAGPQRKMVDALNGDLTGSAAPLSPDQIDSLVGILAKSKAPMNGVMSLDWTSALPAIQQLLTPAQTSAFAAEATRKEDVLNVIRLVGQETGAISTSP